MTNGFVMAWHSISPCAQVIGIASPICQQTVLQNGQHSEAIFLITVQNPKQ
jgi:hypothetical protein